MKEIIFISEAYITLGQLLKHANIISSGGMAKWFLSEHTVYLDGELENRRGKKLFPGSVVEIAGHGQFIIKQDSKYAHQNANTSELS